jgi:3-methyl-2-oxobutanoate hydroxymethyltransferase
MPDRSHLRTAFSAITRVADALLTSRGSETVQALAGEQIPVVSHLGFVPRRGATGSPYRDGIRPCGVPGPDSASPL